MELKINPEFEEVIPPIRLDVFEQLENNIVSEGQLFSPIITWNGFIVDGHNRYKILQKHPEIECRTYEKHFDNKYEAISWICNHQIGTRNLTPRYVRVLRAKQYDAEKNICKFNGNQYTLTEESGLGKNCPDQKSHGTRTVIAQKIGVPECEIKQAQQLYDGLLAADDVLPGIMQEILMEKINPTDKAIKEIAHLPVELRKEAAENLRKNTDKRKTPNKKQKQLETRITPDTEADTIAPVNEDDILKTLNSAVNNLIDMCNNYFTRFPKLLSDEDYHKKTIETLKEFQIYISKIERN